VRLKNVKFGRSLLVGSAIFAVALGMVWSQRRPLAAGAIDRALAARGVAASYEIKDIGLRTQRIEKLRLGNPDKPDLTAEWAEVSLAPSWGGVTVSAIDARGVRLNGKVVQGRVTWGAVDRLLPASTGRALTLPDIDLQLADARVTLDAEVGIFTADIIGSGRLSNGFRGKVRATAPFAGRDGCRIEAPALEAQIAITRRQPALVGTLRALPSSCRGVTTGPSDARFDMVLNEAFDRWRGNATVAAAGIRQGAIQIAQSNSRFVFWGTASNTQGTFRFASPAARYGGTRMVGLTVEGRFGTGKATTVTGGVTVARAIVDPVQLASLRRGFAGAIGTPIGPIADAWSRAIGRAGEGARVNARFAYDGTAARLSDLRIEARGGGVLTLRSGLVMIGANGASADAALALSGGGFPSISGRLTRTPDGAARGLFEIAPYRANDAHLALAPVRFAARPDGTARIETVATLDGPIGDGRAEGVQVQVVAQRTARGEIVVAPGCTPIAYRRILLAGTALAPGSVTLCPVHGGALVRSARNRVIGGAQTGPLRLKGRVGDQPLALGASGASFDLGGPVTLSGFSALLGPADRRTELRIARIDGVTRANGLSGRYSGLSGNIARVPFLASGGQGTWELSGGRLDVEGRLMLNDQVESPRFKPLSAEDVKLQLKNGRIAATVTLHEPVSTRAIASVAITHDLSHGTGEARLAVSGLNFSKSLQPEAITPLTLGVVADVYGQIDGNGLIRWNGDSLTSSGKFRTEALDFAAAFGPVIGASGEIAFDDLIALSTPPGQQVKLGLVNPGVEVKEGVITFQLRPHQVVEVEHGRWPFAGGQLLLDPALLDFGQPKARTLSFRVTALDAAKFIEQLKLENIAATGTFDGALPIVFDKTGGRIVGGQIVARAGGGMLAYVGDVSNAETNTFAKLAFDALKSIRYGNLAIDLDGSLDGEIVSLVRFDGVNQSPVAPSRIAKSFVGLPFKFNIRVRAPFRGLVNTARSFQDPGLLLNRTVQPVASDKRP
jgi:hypothetical protein